MTIQECYQALEGSYDEVLGRLYSEALVKKFVGMFLADKSYQLLVDSMEAKNYDEAFRGAHLYQAVPVQPRDDRGAAEQGDRQGRGAAGPGGAGLRPDLRGSKELPGRNLKKRPRLYFGTGGAVLLGQTSSTS